MSSLIIPTILLAALSGVIFFLILLLAKSRRKLSAADYRCDESRRHLMEEINGINAAMSLLNGIHESALESSGDEAKKNLARMIIDSACRIMKCPNGSLMLLDKETNELYIAAGKGYTSNSFTTRLAIGEGVAGFAVETGKTIFIDNIDSDVRFFRKEGMEYKLKTLMAVPLKVKNKVIGVLNISAEEPHHVFEERNSRLLNVLACQSAITLENMDAYESLQTFYLEMIETIARTLELKENIAQDQSSYEKIRNWSRAISQELNLPESIIRNIEFAAIIKSIGKIAVDDQILRKPGKLTVEEYEQIKKHPEIGKKILSRVKFLSPVMPMVLYHMERWDGKGYPAGLKGEEIPLGSRIVAVVNSYHAMTSDRPYRKALSVNEAVEELKRGASTQFDPKVIEAFVRVLTMPGKTGDQ